jgi:DNA-binding transcriptional regulator/RsmH inhibitor MraZ
MSNDPKIPSEFRDFVERTTASGLVVVEKRDPCTCCERPRWEKATERMPFCFVCLCVHGAIVGRV